MGHIQLYLLNLLIYMIMLTGYIFPETSYAQSRNEWMVGTINEKGDVLVKKKDETQWKLIERNYKYQTGDMIKTQGLGTATIYINETYVRLNQDTTITFFGKEKKNPTTVEVVKGAVNVMHFKKFIKKAKEILSAPISENIRSVHAEANIEGTEFLIVVGADYTSFTVFEGQVSVINKAGSLRLTSGQSAIARTGHPPVPYIMVRPRDAVQWALYYPPIIYYRAIDFPDSGRNNWQAMIRNSIQSYWKGDLTKAFSCIEKITDKINAPRLFNYRASLLLTIGCIDEAQLDIERTLNLAPGDSDAISLKSIIAVVQNDKDLALDLAKKAVKADPNSATALIALSYALQAHFQIDDALASLQEAVRLQPGNALALARLSELWLSKGYLNKSLKVAKKAVKLNPNISRTQTVLGFAYLTQIKIQNSKDAFVKAIKLDTAAPLPRLGLGLAKIREGNIKEGRREIEIAASLDPNNSLIRSYLGKVYYEEKRNKKASGQFEVAKELDPLDPTHSLYSAILKQTMNRPVEALHDMQKAIELNDNRAVYRSKLLMDEDLAAKSASQARIYKDLGFQQRALFEGWRSLNTNPGSYSAHRFLADSYSALPRHEIARVSELLQSQLLQPINITPIQPQLAESNLFIIDGAGLSDAAFNEYNPLFNRNRLALQANGIVAERDTIGDDLVQSGVLNRMSYSLGQFHYETDGFRKNNDLIKDIYTAFFQVNLSHKTSVQVEYRHTDTKFGDLRLKFDPDDFNPTINQDDTADSIRLGFHHSFTPNQKLIASFVYQNAEFKTETSLNTPFVFFDPVFNLDSTKHKDEDGWLGEARYLFKSCSGRFSITGGLGRFSSELDDNDTDILSYTIPIPGFPSSSWPSFGPELLRTTVNVDNRHTNFYVYSLINFPTNDTWNLGNVTWTIGGSLDFFEGKIVKHDQFNPKLGITWDLNEWLQGTTIRAAAFKTLKRRLVSNQTIEPTQIAGFNQFFDDPNGTETWRYGVAVDQKFSTSLYGGVEYSRREPKTPSTIIDIDSGTTQFLKTDWKEDLARAYLYWTPHRWLSLSAEYQYEWFERKAEDTGIDNIFKLNTHRFPLGIKFFHPSGFSSEFKATYVDQDGIFTPGSDDILVPGDDQFWVFDGSISYRLPKRRGIISVGAKNMFDNDFKFQDTDPSNPKISPDPLAFVRFTLSF